MDGVKETKLLQFYYNKLVCQLVKFGKAQTEAQARTLFSFEDLLHLYEDAFIDLARLVVAYHWARIRASPDVLRSREHMLGSNSYNKSVAHAVWFIQRTAAVLDGPRFSASD